MPGILYLCICILFGISLVRVLIPDPQDLFCRIADKTAFDVLPSWVFTVPAGIITGILSTSFLTYYMTLAAVLCMGPDPQIRLYVLLLSAFLFAACTYVNLIICKTRTKKKAIRKHPNDLFFALITAFLTVMSSLLMLDSFHMIGTKLLAGFATATDLGHHIALTSSFAKGFNFPTVYPYFANDSINYHFFFYYFCGTLEYLGLPIDLCINIPSIISMVCMLMMSGVMATLLSKRRGAFFVAPSLVLFRSSFNCFIQFADYFRSTGSASAAFGRMLENNVYYGTTTYEDWGIWTVNIYGNQRHLMIGIAAALLLIIIVLPYVRDMCKDLSSGISGKEKIRLFFFGKSSWLPEKSTDNGPWKTLLLSLFILIPLPFFHGSQLISALLVLAVLAVFSRYRVIYIAMAFASVLSSFIQTRIFAGKVSTVFSLRINPGFYAGKTFWGVISYLILITGLTLVLSLIYAGTEVFGKKKNIFCGILLLAFVMPMIFAFIFQPARELLTNHKIIQTTITLLDSFVACFVTFIWNIKPSAKKTSKGTSHNMPCRIAACALFVILTVSGAFDWITYFNWNLTYRKYDCDSGMVKWICENTEPDAVFLTPDWSQGNFFLTGRSVYYGYTYFVWSAGYNITDRLGKYCDLLSGCGKDAGKFRSLCKEEGIDYMIIHPDYLTVELPSSYTYDFDPDFFAENLTEAASFPEENIIIYKIS